jgi:hypothetical protein
MPEAASPEEHDLAARHLTMKELCLDLARKHASGIVDYKKQGEVRRNACLVNLEAVKFTRELSGLSENGWRI